MELKIDIKPFLTPISGADPSGENLFYTEVYDLIKEAKRSDDLLEKGEWQTDLKKSDWRRVIEICSAAIKEKSKDLQIAVWLTEALLQHHGFSGLAFGLRLLSGLTSGFWETLYPRIEDGDLDFRVGPFTYLNEKMPDAIYKVPICDPDHSKGFSYYVWEESRQVGFDSGLDKEQKDRRRHLIDSGKISAEEFKTAVNLSSIGFYSELHNQLVECHDNLKALDKIVTEKFVPDPPGFTHIADAIEACLRVVGKIVSEKKKSEVAGPEDEAIEQAFSVDADDEFTRIAEIDPSETSNDLFSKKNAISDISDSEIAIWKKVANKAGNGHLKGALDQLMAAAALAPSVRQKNRYLLLVAKLCIRAGRYDLARPIVEKLYELIETLKLEKWEHPAWIADVIETLYRCLEQDSDGQTERAMQLFQKLCTLNITKAAAYRIDT
jgi:type VI secretion system protein ImpA